MREGSTGCTANGDNNCQTCDVIIGDKTYCSQCATGYVPIDGTCTQVGDATSGKCLKADGTAVGKDDTQCGQCGAGYFLHKGGCYKFGNEVAVLICNDAASPGGRTDAVEGVCSECNTTGGFFKNPEAAVTTDSCISCSDTAGVTIGSGDNTHTYKGVDGCVRCAAPQAISTPTGAQVAAATCTTCGDGKYGAACDQNCDTSCKSCTGAGNTACTSCKTSETANGKEYFRIKDDAAKAGECVTETDCKQDSTHFPTTTTDGKKICTLCSDAANGGIADCQTCTPKTAVSLAEAPSVTCSACTTDTNKPNKAGTQCFKCQLADCSHCNADGVCETCSDGKKVSPGGSSCVTACPENSSEQSGACVCSSGFAASGDSCVASSSVNLSTGAIAGISVAAVVVVGGLVGFLCWWFVCRGKA